MAAILRNHVVESRYKIGEIRYVRPTADHVIIEDDLTRKNALLNHQKWSNMMMWLQDINEAIAKFHDNQEIVKFRRHIGGAYYVSVTSGIHCVDIRKFYLLDEKLMPSRDGIGLRFSEWENFCLLYTSDAADE